jgi:2-polyprenyl-6-methoxyphenol hydroxylase-like FAD-dependent oxidoreductase
VKNKSKLHARTAVVGYEETSDGIIVMTQNGEQHYGDILIGADGVHSNVRQLMAEKISMVDENLAKRINESLCESFLIEITSN